MDKCVYCRTEISDGRYVSVCDLCGEQVWGMKMFNAIKQNMSQANEKGDLFQGSVCDEVQRQFREAA